MQIESRNNPVIKRVKALAATKGRKQSGLHFIEGRKLIMEAVISGMTIVEGFVEEHLAMEKAVLEGSGATVYTVTRPVMEALCATETPQGVCATVKTPVMDMPPSFPSGMIIVLETLQDPGNMGVILRTADAMGAAGVLLSEDCRGLASPYSLLAS